MPKKKRESKKPFIAGFVVTIAVLVGGTIALLYLNPPVPVNHIGSVPEYSPMWAKYVPASAVQFGFENYTGIRLYNSSYPTQYKFLLDISDVGVELKSTSINSVLSVTLDKPNESVAFAFVNQGAWNNFTDAFSKVGFAVTVIGDNSLYYVRNAEQGQFQYGWIALIPGDRGIAFALGDTDAKSALSICLEVTQSDSWISTLNVRQMLYLVNGTQHLAVGIQGFPGVLPEANNTLTAVDDTGSQVLIRRVLQFQNATMALQKYDLVRQDYLNSRQFGVYDSYVKATEYEAQNDLIGAVRLVE